MGWLKKRRAVKTLKNLGMSESDISEITSTLTEGYKDAKDVRNELRKKESKTYRKLIKQINNISYEPRPAKDKYDTSLALVHDASLTEWERNDLLTQTEGIYGEILQARPYLQVLSMLNHIKSDNVTRIQKIDASLKLIDNNDITESEKEELKAEVKKVYGY